MTLPSVFKCDNSRLGELIVPAIELRLGDLLLLKVPPITECERKCLLDLLFRSCRSTRFTDDGCSQVVDPFTILSDRPSAMQVPVVVVLKERGLSHLSAIDLLRSLNIDAHSTFQDCQLTERLLINLQLAIMLGVTVSIISMDGLDPLGYKKVIAFASRHNKACSAILLIDSDIFDTVSSAGMLDGVCCRVDTLCGPVT